MGRDAPPGSYVHLLRQIRGLEPSEPMQALPPEVDANTFEIEIASEVAECLVAGTKLEFEVRVENGSAFRLSSNDPFPVHLSYHWLDAEGGIAVHDGIRTMLLPPLSPRSSGHYVMQIEAPPAAGSFCLQLALVQENVRWFDPVGKSGLRILEVQPRVAGSG